MIVGVARPHATVTVPRKDATVILALDVSRSMSATDVTPVAHGRGAVGRDEVPRRRAEDVPRRDRRDRLERDGRAAADDRPSAGARQRSRRSAAARAPCSATRSPRPVDAGAEAAHAAAGEPIPTAVLVISDGADQGSRTTPQAAATKAKAAHVPVYTVLVGTPNGVVERTLTGGFRERIRVPASPETLRAIARTSGGEFFSAPSAERVREVYRQLGTRLGHYRQTREVSDAFAGGAALLLLAGGALSAIWFRRVP